jgi:hypothetical protein
MRYPRFQIQQISEHRWVLNERFPYGDSGEEWIYKPPFPAAADCVTREGALAKMRSIVTGEMWSADEPLLMREPEWFDEDGNPRALAPTSLQIQQEDDQKRQYANTLSDFDVL